MLSYKRFKRKQKEPSNMKETAIKKYIRALRLPFLAASVFPFIFGSFLIRSNFSFLNFILGLLAVVFTHLGANLINDYADSKSGADWQDRRFWGLFGGSKLIQEGALSEKFYLKASLACMFLAFVSVIYLTVSLENISTLGFYLIILMLGFFYSHKPLQLSYRRMGEFVIFILFGPALVMGGHFIQTGVFPDLKSFILSISFGLFTTAILFSNEVPDFYDDIKSGKRTWASIVGPEKSYIIYYILQGAAFISIIVGILMNYLGLISLLSFLLVFFCLKAGRILRSYHNDKPKLIESSALTIKIQTMASIVLIIDILI